MKLEKKLKEKKKYSFISVEDLKLLEERGLQLSEEIKHIDFVNNPKEFAEKSTELHQILTDLKKYKKYAKN